jgi:hypothetical protein
VGSRSGSASPLCPLRSRAGQFILILYREGGTGATGIVTTVGWRRVPPEAREGAQQTLAAIKGAQVMVLGLA